MQTQKVLIGFPGHTCSLMKMDQEHNKKLHIILLQSHLNHNKKGGV